MVEEKLAFEKQVDLIVLFLSYDKLIYYFKTQLGLQNALQTGCENGQSKLRELTDTEQAQSKQDLKLVLN